MFGMGTGGPLSLKSLTNCSFGLTITCCSYKEFSSAARQIQHLQDSRRAIVWEPSSNTNLLVRAACSRCRVLWDIYSCWQLENVLRLKGPFPSFVEKVSLKNG